jgi:hypothetical protein
VLAEIAALELGEDRGLQLAAEVGEVVVAGLGDLRAAGGDRGLDGVEVEAALDERLADGLELGLQGGGLEAQGAGLDGGVVQQQVDAALQAGARARRQDGGALAGEGEQAVAQALDLAGAEGVAVGLLAGAAGVGL